MKKYFSIIKNNGTVDNLKEFYSDNITLTIKDSAEIDREEITEEDFKNKKYPKRLLDKAKLIKGG